jgi:hypothetical protein
MKKEKYSQRQIEFVNNYKELIVKYFQFQELDIITLEHEIKTYGIKTDNKLAPFLITKIDYTWLHNHIKGITGIDLETGEEKSFTFDDIDRSKKLEY